MCKCPVICQEACDNVACYEATHSMKAEPVTSKDPNSYIQASAETLAETLLSKNSDYAPTGEFSNFEKAAEVASIGVLQVMVAQAAIKMTRIESLMGTQDNPRVVGEPLKDSLLDLAGYAVIAHAYLESVELSPIDQYQEASTALREAMENPEGYRKAAFGRMVEISEDIRNAMEDTEAPKGREGDPGLHGNPHTCNYVEARGGMDKPLGYYICGICGVLHV